ncbi:MAG: DM13 domain-containing protein [Candidatus Eremiobacteraeota bacterium]|nr:DM13 domain-containing protein [Candidatus Eremiobacteraeota bacterium]
MNFTKLAASSAMALGLALPAIASAAPTALESGNLVAGAHDTAGTVTIYRLDNGDRVLRLTNFHTSNGPDVHIYLTSAEKVKANGDVTGGKYLDLGSLKGNIGDQNYTIPSGVALADYHSVSVWCARFHVNFGAAQLN